MFLFVSGNIQAGSINTWCIFKKNDLGIVISHVFFAFVVYLSINGILFKTTTQTIIRGIHCVFR